MSISFYKGHLDADDCCPLTLKRLDSVKYVVQTSCGHLFSYDGLKKHLVMELNSSCPTCDTPLDSRVLFTLVDKAYSLAQKALNDPHVSLTVMTGFNIAIAYIFPKDHEFAVNLACYMGAFTYLRI